LKKVTKLLKAHSDELTETIQEDWVSERKIRKWKLDNEAHVSPWDVLINESSPYQQRMLSIYRPGNICDCTKWDEGRVFEWCSSIGAEYVAYAELFKNANIDGNLLLEFSMIDFQELGIRPLHSLNILLELEKVRTNKSYLILPWSPVEVIEWLEVNDVTCNTELVKSENMNGDLLCIVSKEILMVDLNFSEASAQKLIEHREKQMIDRPCFRFLLGRKFIDRRVYELVRNGRVSFNLLLKDSDALTKVEEIILSGISPEFLKELREFAKNCISFKNPNKSVKSVIIN